MHWTKGKCEWCVFWRRDRRVGAGVEVRGTCFVSPGHLPTYDTSKCGQFKKASRREIARRQGRTKEVAAMKMEGK